jgi:hypothetical protein
LIRDVGIHLPKNKEDAIERWTRLQPKPAPLKLKRRLDAESQIGQHGPLGAHVSTLNDYLIARCR